MSSIRLVSCSNLDVIDIAMIARVSTTPLDIDVIPTEPKATRSIEGYRKDVKLCNHLYTAGHWSVFEHVSLTYLLECSRACSLQLARHRHISRTEMSQRYVKFTGLQALKSLCEIPPEIKDNGDKELQYCLGLEQAFETYGRLTRAGVKPEDARFLLPEATKTRMFITLNLRTLLELTQKRACDPRAQWEIRELVQKMWNDIPGEIKEIFRPELKWLDDKTLTE